jgi:hypothetical protein
MVVEVFERRGKDGGLYVDIVGRGKALMRSRCVACEPVLL